MTKGVSEVKWIGSFIKKVWFLLTLKVLFAVLEGLAPYIVSKSLINLVNEITNSGKLDSIVHYALILSIAIFYQRIQMNMKMPIDTLFSARSREFIEYQCCNIVQNTPLEIVESAEFQEQYSYIPRYVNKITGMWDKVSTVFASSVQIVSLTVLLISEGWYYALILFVGVLPLWKWFGLASLTREELDNKLQLIRNKTGYYYSLLVNGNSIKESRIFGNGNEIKRRWVNGEESIQKANWEYRMKNYFQELKYRLPYYGSLVICLLILAINILGGRAGAGVFVGLLFTFQSYQSILSELFFVFPEFKMIHQNFIEIRNFSFKFALKDRKDTDSPQKQYVIHQSMINSY